MTAAESAQFSVVVIGAGPTGLALSNLLGCYGVSALVVERNLATVQEPRAVSIDDESLRTVQSAGLIDRVLEHVVPGYGSRYVDAAGRCFLEVLPTEIAYGYPRRNAFRQPVFEAQLNEGLSRFPNVQTLFGWRLDRFEEKDGVVCVSLADANGAIRSVRCSYLVGCDGAASTVRNQLGLDLQGETFSEKWLIVDLENSPAPVRDTIVFCNIQRPCIALPGPDVTRRFEFKLVRGETPEDIMKPESVAALLDAHGAAPQSVIRRKTVYTFHARLAPVWKSGRVMLAGDACHLTPPFAGQGMNSGIRDAHNLSWKLAAVVSGRLGPELLETYQCERRSHVGEMIKLALRMGRIMAPSSRLVGFLTRTAFRSVNMWRPARDYFGQMKFKPAPRFDEGFLITGDSGNRHPLVGRLLRQPVVEASNGHAMLLDNVLGNGFSLLAITEDVKRFSEATQHDIWRRLAVRRVALNATGEGSAPADVHVAKAAPSAVFGQATPAKDLVLLIRPDRYVAGVFLLSDADAFAAQLQIQCARTWSSRPTLLAA